MFIPVSFQDKPYARQHFERIVLLAQKHPFYQQKLKDLSKGVPLLQREDIVQNNELFLDGNPVTGRTSGSTGVPVELNWGPGRQRLENKDNQMFAEWMGGRLPRMDIISTTAHEKSATTLDVNASLHEQARFIQDMGKQGYQALLSYPSNMLMLCDYLQENHIDVSFIKRVVCMSEVYEPHHERAIQETFTNATTWSSYSSTEVGSIAFQCPVNKNMHHVMAHKLGVEILDEAGMPCKEGETGRVVVTDYFNPKTPFIRYEIGDLAAPASCTCNTIALPAIQNIVGKVRGTLKRLDGSRVVFTDLSVAIRDLPYTKQYQVIQEGLKDFTVRFVKKYSVQDELIEKDLATLFYTEFNYHPNLSLKIEDRIEKEKNGKFYASICRV